MDSFHHLTNDELIRHMASMEAISPLEAELVRRLDLLEDENRELKDALDEESDE